MIPQLGIAVNDSDGDIFNITWNSNSSGSWQTFGTNSSLINGTYYQINSNFSDYSTIYWWNVIISDGKDINISTTFFFKVDI